MDIKEVRKHRKFGKRSKVMKFNQKVNKTRKYFSLWPYLFEFLVITLRNILQKYQYLEMVEERISSGTHLYKKHMFQEKIGYMVAINIKGHGNVS